MKTTQNKKKPFYITTTLPYVNGSPHIGFALEIVRADIIARHYAEKGYDVFFNTGTDEHGTKIFRKAAEQGKDPQKYVDELAVKYKELISALGIMSDINFVRTTDTHHVKAAQEFWKVVDKNGYIYKKNYSVKYCVGCELEKTDSELVDGRCPLHPHQDLEVIQEENYFFKFSAFEDKLKKLYESRPKLVIPDFRYKEIKSFVSLGLEDFSISRLKSKMPWGVPVPGDEDQVMYVWFDALVNYISAVGWPDDEVGGAVAEGAFEKWWNETGGVVQYCGKDNLRQQSAMWQAMLLAAGLSPSQSIIINGFITGEGGLKMSKSLGNTVDPFEVVAEYGTDPLRYYVARELHPFEDSPFTHDKFKECYNAHLANGVGNFTSRVLKLATSNGIAFDRSVYEELVSGEEVSNIIKKQEEAFDDYDIQRAANAVWELVTVSDKMVQDRAPFKKIKTDREGAEKDIKELLARLYQIGKMLSAILPDTSAKIVKLVETNSMPEVPLFVRK